MSTEDKDQLLAGHDYDGIREFDNPLPDWFVKLFYGCIVFAFLYFAYYSGHAWAVSAHAGTGYNLSSSGAMLAATQRRTELSESEGRTRDLHGAELLALLKAPASVSKGEAVYKANCTACHGDQGQGVVGPNLTDRFWIHGGAPDALVESIAHGYPDKGMPAWKAVLGPDKVRAAAAYVLSLRGMPVANAKAPQGTEEP